MYKGKLAGLSGAICCAVLLAIFAQGARAQDKSSREYITNGYIQGTYVSLGGIRTRSRTGPFTVRITGYTTIDEAQQMQSALQSGGQDGLLNAIRGMDKGRVQFNNRIGVPITAVMTSATETGTKITIIYERRLGFSELRYGSRSADYRFGYMEIFLNSNGKGEGTLIPAARIRMLNNGTWEVENFGEFPARLMGVQVRR
jgi:hypothetical protein